MMSMGHRNHKRFRTFVRYNFTTPLLKCKEAKRLLGNYTIRVMPDFQNNRSTNSEKNKVFALKYKNFINLAVTDFIKKELNPSL